MAHLHALIAADSPSGVLIRGGPGKLACTIGWDRLKDTFHVGQWLKQKLLHEDADLSPDGRWMAYYITTNILQEHGAYRAVSRPPWLKAVDFWSETAHILGPGPAVFVRQEKEIVLYERPHHFLQSRGPKRHQSGLRITSEPPHERDRWFWLGYYGMRLQRDGWELVAIDAQPPSDRHAWTNPKPASFSTAVWEKALLFGWKLRQFDVAHTWQKALNRRAQYQTYSLIGPDGMEVEQAGWEWADLDPCRNRLVWTAGMRLEAAGFSKNGLEEATVLYDSTSMEFEAIQAPY